jgi:hypothetical protein
MQATGFDSSGLTSREATGGTARVPLLRAGSPAVVSMSKAAAVQKNAKFTDAAPWSGPEEVRGAALPGLGRSPLCS